MKSLAVLALAALVAAPVFALAQTYGEPQGGAQPDRRSNKPLAEGAKDSISEGKKAVQQSGRELKEDAQKGTRAVKRRVAVALCNDGKYSYTQKNTCSDHGGIKERLKKEPKPAA